MVGSGVRASRVSDSGKVVNYALSQLIVRGVRTALMA